MEHHPREDRQSASPNSLTEHHPTTRQPLSHGAFTPLSCCEISRLALVGEKRMCFISINSSSNIGHRNSVPQSRSSTGPLPRPGRDTKTDQRAITREHLYFPSMGLSLLGSRLTRAERRPRQGSYAAPPNQLRMCHSHDIWGLAACTVGCQLDELEKDARLCTHAHVPSRWVLP